MGLIKTGLKAAVVVKVGHVVHDRIRQRQQAQAPDGSSAAKPDTSREPQTAAPALPDEVLARLEQLGQLKAAGVLTEAEFEAQKARILSG